MKCFSTWVRVMAVALAAVLVGTAKEPDGDRFAGVSPKDRMAWKLAVNTATRRMEDAAEEVISPDAEQMALIKSALTDAMAGDLVAHRLRDVSRGICLENARFLLKQIFEDRLELILKVANEQSTVRVVASDLTGGSGAEANGAAVLNSSLDEFGRRRFDALFEDVRSSVVERGKKDIDRSQSIPSFEDIDALLVRLAGENGLLAWPWTETVTNGLQAVLIGKVSSPVSNRLEELDVYSQALASGMIDLIRNHYGWQIKTVDQVVAGLGGAVPVAAVQVESQILAALMSAIESGKDVPEGSLSSTVTIFSCVKSYIRTLAHRLETERLSEFLRSTPLLTVDPAWLTETLRSDLIVHRQSAKSRQLLLDALCANRRSFLVGSYAGDLTPAETERLNLLLEKDPTFTDIIRRRLAERVDALLPEIRGAVAQSQYAENFGHLESLTVLPDVLLSEIHSTQGALPSSVDAALTFLNRGDILVPDFPDDLLDEAILLLLQRIHNLISVAQAALTRQLELVKDIESSQQETLRRDMAAGAMQHAMQNDWFLQFQGRWSEAVSKAPTAYTQMTAPARDAINVAFFRLYEDALQEQMRTMETRLVEQAQIGSVAGPVAPPPQVGEEAQIAALLEGVVAPPVESVLPSPPASPVQGMIPDVLMVLSGELADRCEVSLSIPAFEVSVAFTVEIADADAAASSLFLQIRPYMAQLARYAQSRWKDRPWRFGRRHSGESPEVTVHLQIESREVRHRTIHLLQRFLEAELGTRGNQLEPPTDVTLAFDVLL